MTLQGDFQLPVENLLQFFGISVQHFRDGHFHGHIFFDDQQAGIGGQFAVGIGVQLFDSLLRIDSASQTDFNLDAFSRVIGDGRNLQLALPSRPLNRGNQRFSSRARRNFPDDNPLVALGLNSGSEANSTLAVVVLPRIHNPALLKIRQYREGAFFEDGDLGLQELPEVMREDMGGHPDRDAVGSQHQQRRHFCRQADGFLVAPVIRIVVDGDVPIEQHFFGQRREAAFDIAAGGSTIACQDIAIIPLPVNKIAFIGQQHQRGSDRGVAVGMEAHRAADHIGHLVVSPVINQR